MYMMEHGESIYNIIPPKPVVLEKPPMHKSKHSGQIPPTASTFHQKSTTMPGTSNLMGDQYQKPVPDRSSRIMGKPNGYSTNDPNSFMPKGAHTDKIMSLAEAKRTKPDLLQPQHLKPSTKPGVPRAAETKPIMNLVTAKNFVVANAVETILAAPKRPQQGVKDYVRKEDYGKTPKYLEHVKQDIAAEYDYIRQLAQEQEDMNQSRTKPLEEDERLDLIRGLKAKWESVNTEYQGTTHITKLDTMGKMKRKEKWEAELTSIEKDIERLNKKHIVVDAFG